MTLNRTDLKSGIITIFAALCVFLATGLIVPAWCEPAAALKSGETGESSSITPWTTDYIRKRPYLIYSGRPTAMTVLWQTYQTPAMSTIEWGTTTGYGRGPIAVHEDGNSSDKHQFSYTISNLLPATKYYYRVTNDTFSHTGSFTTAPRPGETSLSFYGYGDTRAEYLNPPVDHNAVLSALLTDMDQNPEQRQTLLVHMGDYVYNGLNEFLWDVQQFNLEPAYDAMHSTFAKLPLMGVLGNHEGYDAYAAKKTVMNYENIGDLFRKYYPYHYPNNNRFYYSFDYGPVHFVVIDTWSYQGASSEQQTIDAVQANWLKRDLRASRKPWKIAMLHTPIWACLQGNAAMQAQLTPILKEGGVHMVLQGHSHYYSHAETEGPYAGMTWLVLGGGGAPINPEAACVQETNKMWPPFAAFKFHFARFDVSGNTMTVTVIDKDGAIIETFQVTN
ncbi:MAG TPA: metallophosphoesterase family protein [Syntrophorhabdaceae bacterium]|jgi:phosphodiesterase/alkaline phosphatase D-like protein